MACVSLCLLHCSDEEQCSVELSGEHGTDICFESDSVQTNELIGTNSDFCCQLDSCPMKPLPVCALQKSTSFDFQAHSDYQLSSINFAIPAKSTYINNPQYLTPQSYSDPPLERLCTLRI